MKSVLRYFFFVILFFCRNNISLSQNIVLNTQQIQAFQYLDSMGSIKQSAYWQHIKPHLLLQNIRKNITTPMFIYPGTNTNFCGYAAVSYSCINTYPLRYARFMIELYNNGEAHFRKVHFNPSKEVKQAAGLLKFKGELDINHADQMWYMSLADCFKGYVNLFSLNYKPGSENRLWPATNFAKFNRMLRRMCDYKVSAVGTDLFRPMFKDITFFLSDKLQKNHQVFLFVNNAIMHKGNHNKVRYRIPTHYVVLLHISENDGLINLTYWDYGFKTMRQMPVAEFKDILFGVTWCNKKSAE